MDLLGQGAHCPIAVQRSTPRAESGLSLRHAPMAAMRDKDETALAVLARVASVAHRLERGDFAN